MGRNGKRRDRSVDHTQVARAVDDEVLVHNTTRVAGEHGARAARVIFGVHDLTDPLFPVRVGLHRVARLGLAVDHVLEWRLLRHLARKLETLTKDLDVDVVVEVLRVDLRRVEGIRRRDHDRATRKRVLQSSLDLEVSKGHGMQKLQRGNLGLEHVVNLRRVGKVVTLLHVVRHIHRVQHIGQVVPHVLDQLVVAATKEGRGVHVGHSRVGIRVRLGVLCDLGRRHLGRVLRLERDTARNVVLQMLAHAGQVHKHVNFL